MKIIGYLFILPAALVFFAAAGLAIGFILWCYLLVQIYAEFKRGWEYEETKC